MNRLAKRLRTAWVSYRLITGGLEVPGDIWDWLSDAAPDLYSQVLDC